ncbi:MAG: helix-turn-helix domain-containing protein [Spirochaetota bacterium]|nr:helix-turn-helix domain-containing protein [Spirochaetota bacterium]
MQQAFWNDICDAGTCALRVQAVINRVQGRSTTEIASVLGIDLNSVSAYVKHYNEGGIEALLQNKTKKPGLAPISEGLKNRLTQFVCQEKPKDATHWSTRELSKRFGISHTVVNTILRERGIKPHLVKHFQLSTDKDFICKLQDVVIHRWNPEHGKPPRYGAPVVGGKPLFYTDSIPQKLSFSPGFCCGFLCFRSSGALCPALRFS